MNVLIFNATRPLEIGGVKRYAKELTDILSFNGVKVGSIVGRSNGSVVNRFVSLSIDFLRVYNNYDVVHIVTLSHYNIPYMIVAKLLGKKIVVTYHGDYKEEISFFKRPILYLLHLISDNITRILANSIIFPTKFLAIKMNLDSKKKTKVIPNPIQEHHLQNIPNRSLLGDNADQEIILVTSSNFNIWRKCEPIKLLLEAVEILVKEYPLRLLIFGDGVHLRKICNGSCSKEILFMGFRKEFPRFLQAADAFVYISGLDNLPYSVIEAMNMGKVILCNNVGGILENMQAADNYVVQLNLDSIIGGLRTLINDLLSDRDEFKMKGQRNRSYLSENLGTGITFKKYMDLYRQVIEGIVNHDG